MTTSRLRSVSLLLALLCGPLLAAQAPGAAFDSTKAFEHLRQQVAIGPRPSGSPGNVKNREYIKAQMAALGITTTEQAFEDMIDAAACWRDVAVLHVDDLPWVERR